MKDGKGGYKDVKKWIEEHPRRIKSSMVITQKANVKKNVLYSRTMTKEIPENLIEGVKTLAMDQDHEYSIDIDFERKDKMPQQMLIMSGGRRETVKVGDFELFGHTHPTQAYPGPSNTDLRILIPLKPEFIISQKTGKTIILNIENYKKWQHWKASGKDIPHRTLSLMDTKWRRDQVFDWCGVRVYPMMKNVKLEMVDDPHYEKIFPRVKPSLMSQWQSEKKIKK